MAQWHNAIWRTGTKLYCHKQRNLHFNTTRKVGTSFGTLPQAAQTCMAGNIQLNASSIASTLEQCKWRACIDVHQEHRYNSILRASTDHHKTQRKGQYCLEASMLTSSQYVKGVTTPKRLTRQAHWHKTSWRAGTNHKHEHDPKGKHRAGTKGSTKMDGMSGTLVLAQ